MGDRDESSFWDVFGSENFGSNHPFQTTNQSFYGEDFASKRIRLSPDSDNQGGDGESSSPLGLTLRKTPSFLNLLQNSLSNNKKTDDLGSQPISEKLKASNFNAFYIKIGSWERVSRHEGELTAKLYYAKRKLVWEILDGALKSKIEIQWSHITAIRAITPPDEPGTLEIELNEPPLFYREINPQPRKHTLWQQASDFTGGQAPLWRRHYVRFPPGELDRHYEKLLQCDERLLALSEKPFPSHESPFFDPKMLGVSQLSHIFNGYGSSNYQYMMTPPVPSNPIMPGMEYNNPFTSQPYKANFEQYSSGETTSYPFSHQVMATYNPNTTQALYSHWDDASLPPYNFQPHNGGFF